MSLLTLASYLTDSYESGIVLLISLLTRNPISKYFPKCGTILHLFAHAIICVYKDLRDMIRWISFSPFILSFLGTAALEEDAQILKVIEAYCTSAKTRQTLNSSKKTQNVTHTVHVHAQEKRGSYRSLLSLLLPHLEPFFNTGILN